jgi:hypothetical protein
MHGTQVELKKFNTSQLPLRRSKLKSPPSIIVEVTCGAGLPNSGERAILTSPEFANTKITKNIARTTPTAPAT